MHNQENQYFLTNYCLIWQSLCIDIHATMHG
jgi:hypothetical protein